MKVIDTRRNSRPENRGQSERKYVCEPCAKELGAAVGQVSAEHFEGTISRLNEFAAANGELRQQLDEARTQQSRVVSVDEITAYLQSNSPRPADVPAETEE